MSDGPFAKLVPYSSVVGGSVVLHDGKDGPVVGQLALLNVRVFPGEDHRGATERLGKYLVTAINGFNAK